MMAGVFQIAFGALKLGRSIALEETIEQAQERRKPVLLVGLRARVRSVLEKLNVLETLGPTALFEVRLDALNHAAELVADSESERAGPAG